VRQTDGQTDIFRRQRPRYAERRAGKNASRCNRDVDLRKTAQRPMLVDANPPVNSLVYVWATVIGRYNRSDVVLASLVFVLVLRRRLESDLHPADARLSAGRRPCNYRRPSSNRRTPTRRYVQAQGHRPPTNVPRPRTASSLSTEQRYTVRSALHGRRDDPRGRLARLLFFCSSQFRLLLTRRQRHSYRPINFVATGELAHSTGLRKRAGYSVKHQSDDENTALSLLEGFSLVAVQLQYLLGQR